MPARRDKLVDRTEVLEIPDCQLRIPTTSNKEVSSEITFNINIISSDLIHLACFGDTPFKDVPVIIDPYNMAARQILLNTGNLCLHMTSLLISLQEAEGVEFPYGHWYASESYSK